MPCRRMSLPGWRLSGVMNPKPFFQSKCINFPLCSQRARAFCWASALARESLRLYLHMSLSQRRVLASSLCRCVQLFFLGHDVRMCLPVGTDNDKALSRLASPSFKKNLHRRWPPVTPVSVALSRAIACARRVSFATRFCFLVALAVPLPLLSAGFTCAIPCSFSLLDFLCFRFLDASCRAFMRCRCFAASRRSLL